MSNRCSKVYEISRAHEYLVIGGKIYIILAGHMSNICKKCINKKISAGHTSIIRTFTRHTYGFFFILTTLPIPGVAVCIPIEDVHLVSKDVHYQDYAS